MVATNAYGKPVSELTETVKQTVSALATLAAGLAGGLTGNSTADAVAGAQTGKTETVYRNVGTPLLFREGMPILHIVFGNLMIFLTLNMMFCLE